MDSSDNALKRRRNGRLGRVGKALVTVDRIVMDLGAECASDVGGAGVRFGQVEGCR